MFRKAQLKIFAMITCILLAVFIAVLGSINIIMNAVMERQSRNVLRQIAEGVEYDGDTSTFTFVRPPEFKDPPPKPVETTTAETTTEAASTAVSTTAKTTVSKKKTTKAKTTTVTSTQAAHTTAAIQTSAQAQVTTAYVVTEATTIKTTAAPPKTTSAKQTALNKTTAASTEKTKPKKTTTAPHQGTKPQTEPTTTTAPPQQFPENGWDPNGGQWGWWDPGYVPPWGYDWGNGWDWGNGGQQFPPPQYGDGNNNGDQNNNGNNNGNDNNNDPWGGGYIGPPLWGQFQSPPPAEPEAPTEETEQAPVSFIGEEGGIVPLAEIHKNPPHENDKKRNDRTDTEPVPKSLGSIDFFILMSDSSGKFLASMNNEDISDGTAQKYITEILDADAETGRLNNYQFYSAQKDNGTLMVFTDKSAEIDMLNKLTRTTIMIGIASFLILSLAAFFLSVQVVKPLKIAFEKQKQFVSDASHELKTPVTVISANADVLSDEMGDNKWLDYIKSQTERMNVLVNDLLNLTRLENHSTDFIKTDFDASKAIINTALPFECQAFETNKKFVVDIDDGIIVNGSEKHIKQMTAIFIDNALKYSNDGGTVRVSFKRSGDKKVLSVFNTGKGVKASEQDKIFERFYRSDESRTRSTGGYGLGLAIAKSIIDRHRFKITIENNEGENICFIITM